MKAFMLGSQITKLQKLPRLNRSKGLLFALTFAVIGSILLFATRAAGPSATIEPEQGTRTANTSIVNDTGSSGGQAVQFGTITKLVPMASSPGKPGVYLGHLGGPAIDIATEAPRRKMFYLNPGEYPLIAQIKAVNPDALVLVYKDLSSTRDWDCGNAPDLTSGVSYCDANANHPDWFLKDASGDRLPYANYAGHWQMDVGNPAYQQAWLANVKANLQARGWDGVIMDNALGRADTYHDGIFPVRYPDNQSFQNAYKSMLAAVAPPLRSAGLHTLANITEARLYPGVWNDYIANLDGGFDEYWTVFFPENASGNGRVWDWGATGWRDQIAEVSTANALGKYAGVRIQSCGTDRPSFIYGLASYLLVSNGRTLISVGCGDGLADGWFPDYERDLGTPAGDFYQIPGSTSAFRRDFSGGRVIVNASQSTTQTFALGGTYLNQDGNSVSSVTLSGTQAVILRQ